MNGLLSFNFNCSGCLYKLLRRPDAGVILDERLRLNMACDVVKPELSLIFCFVLGPKYTETQTRDFFLL